MKYKLISFALLASVLMTTGASCTKGPSAPVAAKMQPVTLNYWRVWDGPDDFREIINKYKALHPNVTVVYRKLRIEEYESELLNALAEDRGPDIFSINVNQLRQYKSKLAPMPAETSMVYMVEQGTIKKELVPELRVTPSIRNNQVRDLYIDTVGKDVIFEYDNVAAKTKEQRVWGLPLYMDTMATFYNKDLLNNAGIAELSDYWGNDKFKKDLKKLTKQDEQGNILQSGMALGTGANIDRSYDVLAALMMQNGATIIDDQGRVAFRNIIRGKDYNPGIDAARFYADFADPTKDVYSWNAQLNNSLEMFMQGRLAVMYGYAYMLPIIKAQAPKLNYSVRKFPQIEGSSVASNVADYYVEVVSKKSKFKDEAWDFVQFATTKPDNVRSYLKSTKKLAAIRSIIDEQKTDENLGVFAEQLFSARTWYRGINYAEAVKSFVGMLEAITKNPENFEQELKIMEGRLKQTL
ncbi:MAG TPA: extracellular solute-binding protein [bacterium]|nr:extracellular solute-binding protein [bacterium]